MPVLSVEITISLVETEGVFKFLSPLFFFFFLLFFLIFEIFPFLIGASSVLVLSILNYFRFYFLSPEALNFCIIFFAI